MKKFVMGLIVGMLVMVGSSVFAENAVKILIGQAIQGQFNVTIDGEQLGTPAIVVGGTSFLPARSFAEKLGYEVTFDTEGGIQLIGQTMTEAEAKAFAEQNAQEAARQLAEYEATANERNKETMANSIKQRLPLFQGALDDSKDGLRRHLEKLRGLGYTEEKIESLESTKLIREKVAEDQANLDRIQAELDALQTE